MSEREVRIERVDNGYILKWYEYLSTKVEVYVTLKEALKRAAWLLDYKNKLTIEVTDE